MTALCLRPRNSGYYSANSIWTTQCWKSLYTITNPKCIINSWKTMQFQVVQCGHFGSSNGQNLYWETQLGGFLSHLDRDFRKVVWITKPRRDVELEISTELYHIITQTDVVQAILYNRKRNSWDLTHKQLFGSIIHWRIRIWCWNRRHQSILKHSSDHQSLFSCNCWLLIWETQIIS